MNRMMIYLILIFGIYWFVIRKDDKPVVVVTTPTTPVQQNNNGAGQDASADVFSKIAGIVGSFFRGFTGGSDSQTQRN